MTTLYRYGLATLAVLSVASFELPMTAQAQSEAEREAAMHRCILAVQRQYPSTTGEQQDQRVAAYKACMTQAGFRP
jgi:hypothetical protein